MTAAPTAPKLGRYTDLKLLGQGGMGAVYRARDPALDRTVAIKVMLDATPEFLQRFEREARAIARLSHPNVVQVFDFGQDESGWPYFVMELVPGRSLEAVLKERGRLQPLEVAELVRQAAEGLEAAHKAGIIHRDVKPHNLLLEEGGRLRVVDFGVARDVKSQEELTATNATLGTLHYMAPEVLSGESADARSDVYALGLVAFYLLTGRPPFNAPSAVGVAMKQVSEPLPDLGKEAPGTPPELQRLIEHMTRKPRPERIQTCAEVAQKAALLIEQLRTRPTLPVPSRGGPNPVVLGLAAVLGLLSAAVVAWQLARSGRSERPPSPVALAESAPPGAVPTPPADPSRRPPAADTSPPAATAAATATVPGRSRRTGPVRVAILRFRNLTKDPQVNSLNEGLSEVATDVFLRELRGKVVLVERNQLDEMNLPELFRGKEPYMDRDTAARIGRVIGAELVVQGAFEQVGDKLRVSGRISLLETAEILDTLIVTEPYAQPSDLLRVEEVVAERLKEKLQALLPLLRP
ncbi:MAG: protein kinase [Polyangia bacterium]